MTYLLAHDSQISKAKKLHHKDKQKHVPHEVGAIGDNVTMNAVVGVRKKKGSP